mmetsp:Transcript_8940/g.18573  ORF Transcript_8940/g.18573 Transcript_8940/m.18573 type:complete len:347 (+) Transcript_8940:146-1186(+)
MFARSLKPLRYPEPLAAPTSTLGIPTSRRTVSGGTISPTVHLLPQDQKEKEGVELLLGIANIVSKEIASSDKELFDDSQDFLNENKTPFSEPSLILDGTPRGPSHFPSSSLLDEDSAWHRVRTVSIDNEYGTPRRSSPFRATLKPKTIGLLPAVVTPVGKRLRLGRKASIKIVHKAKKEQIKFPKLSTAQQQTSTQSNNNHLPDIMTQHKRKATEQSNTKGKSITTIHRKKFSWKNYPELEAFLVANREEYLRHSALNYTIQQKKYNNKLTERLLDLAAEHLYVFNEEEFSFVTVRDRIRCFYKSYVQSSKKRGIVLGYAARKAGILTPADLQKSARKEGTIITPL